MKTYLSLAFRYLGFQKRRGLLAGAGILLAVALIAAVGSLAASIRQTGINQAIAQSGDFHTVYTGLDEAQLERLRQSPEVDGLGRANDMGVHRLPNLFISLEGLDATVREMLGVSLVAGRFPAGQEEIALEGWVLEAMGLAPTLGQELDLPFERSYKDASGEWQVYSGQARFTLVGIIELRSTGKALGASLGVLDPDAIAGWLPPEQRSERTFVRLAAGEPAAEGLAHLDQRLGVERGQAHPNRSLLIALGEGQAASWPVLFLGGLVMVATLATIYNVFHIAVIERIRQFGMLRALGATAGQVRAVVLLEAGALALVAVPAGLLVGVGFAWGLARSIALFQAMIGELVVPAWALLGAGLAGLLTTLLAALLPAQAAARVSPLEALLNRRERLAAAEHARRPAHFERRLGVTGRIAYANLWREKKRSLVTIFSLGLGMVLFVAFSYFAASSDASSVVAQLINGDFALTAFDLTRPEVGFTPEQAAAVASIPGVEEVIETRCSLAVMPRPVDELSAELQARVAAEEGGAGDVPVMLFGYDSADLGQLQPDLVEGALDPQAMAGLTADGAALALLVDPEGHSGLQVGDTFTLRPPGRGGEGAARTYRVAGLLDQAPVFMGFVTAGPQILVHADQFPVGGEAALINRFDLRLAPGADPAAVEGRLQALAESQPRATLLSFAAEVERLQDQKREMMILFYGLAGIVALIGMLNIVNTLTTSILLRTAEFGMLRAVGLTQEQLAGMTRLEGLFYGLISGVWGALAGTLLAYVLYLFMRAEITHLAWHAPWLPLLGGVLGSILLGVAATLAPSRRVAGLAIVEAIRTVE